jgi:hypothetical protein
MLSSFRRGFLFFLFFIVITPITLSLLAYYPQYNISDEQHLYETYQALLKSDSLPSVSPQPAHEHKHHDPSSSSSSSSHPSLISVMTFNLRFDAEESDPNNRFPRRVPRIISTIERWNPHIIGVQEPFSDELIQLFTVWKKEKDKRHLEGGEKREVPYLPVGFKWPSPSNYVKVVVVVVVPFPFILVLHL